MLGAHGTGLQARKVVDDIAVQRPFHGLHGYRRAIVQYSWQGVAAAIGHTRNVRDIHRIGQRSIGPRAAIGQKARRGQKPVTIHRAQHRKEDFRQCSACPVQDRDNDIGLDEPRNDDFQHNRPQQHPDLEHEMERVVDLVEPRDLIECRFAQPLAQRIHQVVQRGFEDHLDRLGDLIDELLRVADEIVDLRKHIPDLFRRPPDNAAHQHNRESRGDDRVFQPFPGKVVNFFPTVRFVQLQPIPEPGQETFGRLHVRRQDQENIRPFGLEKEPVGMGKRDPDRLPGVPDFFGQDDLRIALVAGPCERIVDPCLGPPALYQAVDLVARRLAVVQGVEHFRGVIQRGAKSRSGVDLSRKRIVRVFGRIGFGRAEPVDRTLQRIGPQQRIAHIPQHAGQQSKRPERLRPVHMPCPDEFAHQPFDRQKHLCPQTVSGAAQTEVAFMRQALVADQEPVDRVLHKAGERSRQIFRRRRHTGKIMLPRIGALHVPDVGLGDAGPFAQQGFRPAPILPGLDRTTIGLCHPGHRADDPLFQAHELVVGLSRGVVGFSFRVRFGLDQVSESLGTQQFPGQRAALPVMVPDQPSDFVGNLHPCPALCTGFAIAEKMRPVHRVHQQPGRSRRAGDGHGGGVDHADRIGVFLRRYFECVEIQVDKSLDLFLKGGREIRKRALGMVRKVDADISNLVLPVGAVAQRAVWRHFRDDLHVLQQLPGIAQMTIMAKNDTGPENAPVAFIARPGQIQLAVGAVHEIRLGDIEGYCLHMCQVDGDRPRAPCQRGNPARSRGIDANLGGNVAQHLQEAQRRVHGPIQHQRHRLGRADQFRGIAGGWRIGAIDRCIDLLFQRPATGRQLISLRQQRQAAIKRLSGGRIGNRLFRQLFGMEANDHAAPAICSS